MHIEQVVFDTVFDTHAGRGDFSFTSRGQPQYGVNLHAGVIPQAGSTYLVAFGVPGDWSTVLGWRDLKNDAIRLKAPTWHTVVSGMDTLVWCAPFFVFGALLLAGMAAALAVLLAICCFIGFQLYTAARRNRAVREGLAQAGAPSGTQETRRFIH